MIFHIACGNTRRALLRDSQRNTCVTGSCITSGINSLQSAIAREKELKGWTRAKKIALIESVNPRWRDLSEAWGKQFLMQGQSMKETDEASARRIKLGTKEQWLPKPYD